MRTRILQLGSVHDPEAQLGKRRVLVGGCFDIIHIGHIRFLQEAKSLKGSLIIALESDDFIRQAKKRQPFHNQRQRAEILSGIRFVDVVVLLPYINSSAGYLNMVKKITPHIIAVESDDQKISQKQKQAATINALVINVTPHVKHTSSSKLIALLEKSE